MEHLTTQVNAQHHVNCAIIDTFHHLLNVLLQIAHQLGLLKKII
jgi:hypothetical protein